MGRICAGWHVKPGYIELLERDYESAQRKRYLRSEHERLSGLLGVGTAALHAKWLTVTNADVVGGC